MPNQITRQNEMLIKRLTGENSRPSSPDLLLDPNNPNTASEQTDAVYLEADSRTVSNHALPACGPRLRLVSNAP